MTYYIDFAPAAQKAFFRLSSDVQRRIRPKIDALAEDPTPRYARRLQGNRKDTYRIRIGDYRVVYTVSHESEYVYVTLVRHRGSVYRDL